MMYCKLIKDKAVHVSRLQIDFSVSLLKPLSLGTQFNLSLHMKIAMDIVYIFL